MDLVSRHLDTVSEFYRDPKSADQLFSSSKVFISGFVARIYFKLKRSISQTKPDFKYEQIPCWYRWEGSLRKVRKEGSITPAVLSGTHCQDFRRLIKCWLLVHQADALADSILRGSRGLSSRQLDLPLTTAVKDGPHFAEASKEREVRQIKIHASRKWRMAVNICW